MGRAQKIKKIEGKILGVLYSARAESPPAVAKAMARQAGELRAES